MDNDHERMGYEGHVQRYIILGSGVRFPLESLKSCRWSGHELAIYLTCWVPVANEQTQVKRNQSFR